MHDHKQFEYMNFMRVIRELLQKELEEVKLTLGTLDLTVPETDDRLIAVPGEYYKVKGYVIHRDSKRGVRFEKEFLAEITQDVSCDRLMPMVLEIADDVTHHFFGCDESEIAIGARPGSHGIKGLA